jgi:hypothetical protein
VAYTVVGGVGPEWNFHTNNIATVAWGALRAQPPSPKPLARIQNKRARAALALKRPGGDGSIPIVDRQPVLKLGTPEGQGWKAPLRRSSEKFQ